MMSMTTVETWLPMVSSSTTRTSSSSTCRGSCRTLNTSGSCRKLVCQWVFCEIYTGRAALERTGRPSSLGGGRVNLHPPAPARSPPGTPAGRERVGVRIPRGRLRVGGDLLSILSIRDPAIRPKFAKILGGTRIFLLRNLKYAKLLDEIEFPPDVEHLLESCCD